MAETETIRIARMDGDERTVINVLSSEERKEALLRAGQLKLQNANNRLLVKQLGKEGAGSLSSPIASEQQSGRYFACSPYKT